MSLEIVRGPVIHSSFHKMGDGSWGENESFYVLDPDSHRIEIFCDMATPQKSVYTVLLHSQGEQPSEK